MLKVGYAQGMNTQLTISQLIEGDKVVRRGQVRMVSSVVVLGRTTDVSFTDGTKWFAVSHTPAFIKE